VAVLVVLVLAGEIGPRGALLGTSLGAVCAVGLAWRRALDVERFTAWLGDVVRRRSDLPPPELDGPLGEFAAPAREIGIELYDHAQKLGTQTARLQTIVAALPDPVMIVDRRLLIRMANPAADRTFGLTLTDAPLGRALRDPGVLAAVNAALAAGTSSSVGFSPTIDRVKHYAARITPIEMGAQETGALVTLREQTEQVMIERMRSDFIANASHEIRTPLAAIVGAAETLRGPARDDAEARVMFLDLLASEAARLQRLVDDLLSLSRVELVAHRPPEDLVDIGETVAEVVARMRPLAQRARVELSAKLPEGLPHVRADADQLQQLVGNLLDNAIKYGPGKPVAVEIEPIDAAAAAAGPLSGRACLAIRVTDHGEGIPPEHIPRVTERFYRVDKARSRRVGGTGLGLAIVKHITRRHQGHLLIESLPGEGSTFSVYLPVAEASD
jgi:two-component system phosphate regulon sensor histidine kinase PhoR